MKAIIMAILGFIYYWVRQKIKVEETKGNISYKSLFELKSDEMILSFVAMTLILIALPEISGILIDAFSLKGYILEAAKVITGFFAGIAGTFIIDLSVKFGKKKLKSKLK